MRIIIFMLLSLLQTALSAQTHLGVNFCSGLAFYTEGLPVFGTSASIQSKLSKDSKFVLNFSVQHLLGKGNINFNVPNGANVIIDHIAHKNPLGPFGYSSSIFKSQNDQIKATTAAQFGLAAELYYTFWQKNKSTLLGGLGIHYLYLNLHYIDRIVYGKFDAALFQEVYEDVYYPVSHWLRVSTFNVQAEVAYTYQIKSTLLFRASLGYKHLNDFQGIPLFNLGAMFKL